MKSVNYYLRQIYRNFTYGDTTYQAVKDVVVDNLNSMGVECSTDDGMTTLAGKILDIEPTIVTDDLVTSIELTSNSPVTIGDDIILSSTLIVSADDDVDLKGVLQNATVNFYLGDTLLGSSITDTNGVATYTYTPSEVGSYTFSSSFNGTDNFDECESSNVNVTVKDSGYMVIINCRDENYHLIQRGTLTLNGTSVQINGSIIPMFEYVPKGTYTVEYTDGTYSYYSDNNPITVNGDTSISMIWKRV